MRSYVIKAVLSNPQHPEYGQATIPFPIPDSEYDRTMEILAALKIGDARERDCRVEKIDSGFHFLDRLENASQPVNVDELDYLAKRLDSFDSGEAAQYQAMLYKEGYWKIEDLINLTFCCQEVTVVTDFSDLKRVGLDHMITLNGGTLLQEKAEKMDLEYEAMKLIQNGKGFITPDGVVYDNGMKLERLYKGQAFPGYIYDRYCLVLALTPKEAPSGSVDTTYLYLPSSPEQINRSLRRGGMHSISEAKVEIDLDDLPDELCERLDIEREPLEELNRMCEAVKRLDSGMRDKLNVAANYAGISTAAQAACLAEELDSFEFIPGVVNPEELGEYMVKESGHFEYDPNLEGFYDYGKLGRQRIEEHGGRFTSWGYICYNGTIPLEELTADSQTASGFQMRGME